MPLGYRLGEDKRIHVDEAPAPIVQEIFPYFIEHRTILSTFRMMRQKYRYEKSERAIGRALCNRTYPGEYHGIKGFFRRSLMKGFLHRCKFFCQSDAAPA